jgi:hypothetical protein
MNCFADSYFYSIFNLCSIPWSAHSNAGLFSYFVYKESVQCINIRPNKVHCVNVQRFGDFFASIFREMFSETLNRNSID